MAFVSWLEIILAVSFVSVGFNCLVITTSTAAILEVIVNQGDAMEAVAFGDGFRLVDAIVACLMATTAILEVLVDWGVTLVAVIFDGGCWLVVESADCLVISTAILVVIVNWGVAMVADERWYGFSFSVIGGLGVCNVTSTPCCAPRELLLWTARQERREISRNPYVKWTKKTNQNERKGCFI